MSSRSVSLRMIGYELRNTLGNPFTLFFGIAFPILMSALISNAFMADMPAQEVPPANTAMFFMMLMIIPMATLLIGHAANYSQELESGVPLRLKLFGFQERGILIAKMIANLIFMTGGIAVFVLAELFILKLLPPTPGAVLTLALLVYLLAAILFVIAHAVATLFGKFGPTYAVTMTLYFGLMFFGGMMGMSVDRFPDAMRAVANLLPMTHLGAGFVGFWQGGAYDFGPMAIAFALWAGIAGVLIALSLRKVRRRGG